MTWNALAVFIAFFVGLWCGAGWHQPFIKRVEKAEKERDYFIDQYIKLRVKSIEVIEKWQRAMRKAGIEI